MSESIEAKEDYQKKIEDLKFVKRQLVRLGNIITEVDSQHREVVLEPKFQEKIEKLIQEADILSKLHARAKESRPRVNSLPLKTTLAQTNLFAQISAETLRTLRDLKADPDVDSPIRNDPEQTSPPAKRVNEQKKVPETVETRRRTKSVGVGGELAFRSYVSEYTNTENLYSTEFPSPNTVDFGQQYHERKRKSYRNQYFESKFHEQQQCLTRMENNVEHMTRKLSEFIKSNQTDQRKCGEIKMETKILTWKYRAERICAFLELQSIYEPEAKDNKVELSYWKHRAQKLFRTLVKLKRADARVWKAAKLHVDFDEALDILTDSTRPSSRKR